MLFSFVVCRQIYLFFVTKIAFNEYTVGMGYPGRLDRMRDPFLPVLQKDQMGRKGKRRLKISINAENDLCVRILMKIIRA